MYKNPWSSDGGNVTQPDDWIQIFMKIQIFMNTTKEIKIISFYFIRMS